jgi:predicted transcriptional regulator
LSGNSVNRQRARILISLFPGIHLRELQRLLNISFNTARHHVDTLFKSGEIERQEEGGYSRLYPKGTSLGDKALFSSARSPTKRVILLTLLERAHLSNKQLSELTGLAKSTISEQVQSLLDSHIVDASFSSETRTTYSLRDPASVSRALVRNDRTFLDGAAERFIDLFDF